MAENRVVIEIVAQDERLRAVLDQAARSTTRFSGSLRNVTREAQAEQRALASLRSELSRVRSANEGAASAGQALVLSLRRQIVATAGAVAGYQGLRAATQQIGTAENAARRLAFLSDSTVELGDSLRFTTSTAREQAAEINSLRDSYARLSVFQQQGLITTAEQRDLTLGLINAQAALGATNEQLGLAYFGLQQILGQGRVQLQELNQVTEALPGLLGAVAAAAGQTAGEFRNFITEVGLTSRDFVPLLIQGLQQFEGAAEQRLDGVQGTFTRFFNELKLLAENSGPALEPVLFGFRRLADLAELVNRGIAEIGRDQDLEDALALQRVNGIVDELATRGFPQMAASLRDLAANADGSTESITALFERARTINDQVNVLLQQRQQLQRRLANEEEELSIRVTRRVLQERQAAIEKDVQNSQRRVDRLLQEEQRFAQQAADLRIQLADQQRTAEERITDAGRSRAPDWLRQYQIQQEFAQRLIEVRRELRNAAEAETEAEREAALAAAEGAQKRAEALNEEIGNEFRFKQALVSSSRSRESITETKIRLAERDQEAAKDAREAEQQRIEQLKVDLESVNAQLAELAEGKEIDLKANVDKTRKELEGIQDQLDELARGVTIPINTSGPGLATGGIPRAASGWIGRAGQAGRDSIPIMVGAGEAVLNRHQQRFVSDALRRTYGFDLRGLFSRVNRPHSQSLVSRLPIPSLPGFASGGLVQAAQRAPRSDEVVIRFGPSASAPRARTSRQDAAAIVDLLTKAAGGMPA